MDNLKKLEFLKKKKERHLKRMSTTSSDKHFYSLESDVKNIDCLIEKVENEEN